MIETQTIKEVAKAANISKTSVYNLIKRHGIQTYKNEGITYLDKKAVNLVFAYFSSERHETIENIIDDTKEEKSKDFQGDFQHSKHDENSRIIGILEKELDEKNKTIQALIQAMTADKINDAARLMLQDKNHSAAASDTVKSKSKFFSRYFKRK